MPGVEHASKKLGPRPGPAIFAVTCIFEKLYLDVLAQAGLPRRGCHHRLGYRHATSRTPAPAQPRTRKASIIVGVGPVKR